VLALGRHAGPFLWQLPEMVAFDEERLGRFFDLLPRSSKEAVRLARRHTSVVKDPMTITRVDVPYRHVLEPRHPSFFTDEAHELLRAYDVGMVVADTGGRFPTSLTQTTDFMYVRLHGSEALYASRYRDDELDLWAGRIRAWRRASLDV
jgi:uncharacterized protein YecE (DUF72 family)